MMTIADLIERLKVHPSNTRVVLLSGADDDVVEIEEVQLTSMTIGGRLIVEYEHPPNMRVVYIR